MSNSVLKKPEYIVAPLAGAWVEIALVSCKPKFNSVAPLAGAWVEIVSGLYGSNGGHVAPLAGAWVEIKLYF